MSSSLRPQGGNHAGTKGPTASTVARPGTALGDLVRAHSTPQATGGAGAHYPAHRSRQAHREERRRAGRVAQDSAPLAAAEASADVAERLSDAPRCGAPAILTSEQICQIVVLA